MDKEIKNVRRRQMLKGIALGGGAIVTASLPEKWIKPVVDFMVVPAHAQTSSPPSPPPCAATSITAGSILLTGYSDHWFTDGVLRSLAIWAANTGLDGVCCESPLSVTVGALPPGIYVVSMGIDSPIPITTTLSISTDCGTCSITQAIAGGAGDGSGTAMAEITLPAGTCEEVNYPHPAAPKTANHLPPSWP